MDNSKTPDDEEGVSEHSLVQFQLLELANLLANSDKHKGGLCEP